MSEVEQLEERIGNLSPQDLTKFRTWFVEFDARVRLERKDYEENVRP